MNKEIVLVKNEQDKKYLLTCFESSDEEYVRHGKEIEKFNETPFMHAIQYKVCDEDSEKSIIQSALACVEMVGYKQSEDCTLPKFLYKKVDKHLPK